MKNLTNKLGEHFDWQGSGSKVHIKKNWTLGCGLLTRTNAHKKRITDFSTSRLRLHLLYRHQCVQKANYSFQTKPFVSGIKKNKMYLCYIKEIETRRKISKVFFSSGLLGSNSKKIEVSDVTA
jgi:hypothetical protein